MPKPPRTAGRQRVYDSGHIKRLAFIRRSRERGFSLDEVRALLALVDGGDYTCGEVHAMTLATSPTSVARSPISSEWSAF